MIDQQPLRRRVADDCAELMERLQEIRGAWHQYDREDKPAFIRWRAREFGALLSKAREVEAEIRDLQAIVHEVEMEMRLLKFQDPPYRLPKKVMFRAAENPVATENEAESWNGDDSRGSASKVSDFEKESLFQEWVQKFLGTNPDKMDDEAYTTTFEVFKAHMFNPGREDAPSGSLPRQQPHSARPPVAESAEEKTEEASSVDARVKSLYRKLVRRLHPDHRADRETAVSNLWHEVQEAYAAADVARMEILLALSDIQSKCAPVRIRVLGKCKAFGPNFNDRCTRSRKASRKRKRKMPGILLDLVPEKTCAFAWNDSSNTSWPIASRGLIS